ncbi:DUF6056 family protein [Helicobacter saguini]|uniref:Uncharacterized protein n=1 Tax=Helicobacter saguini TaxID=1548018 RepID=A0A6L7DF68_9HELI|nr:hypothetical protein [Helicobacter saguini]MWV70543.1 hypothetical protein [Helicobacter saguini]MWV72447.1 hypothetical protein [Helicobacter saguini]
MIYFFFFIMYERFPRNNFEDISTICFILFFLMSATISFGSVFFWQAGSMNHLWAWFLILAFLIPYRVFLARYFGRFVGLDSHNNMESKSQDCIDSKKIDSMESTNSKLDSKDSIESANAIHSKDSIESVTHPLTPSAREGELDSKDSIQSNLSPTHHPISSSVIRSIASMDNSVLKTLAFFILAFLAGFSQELSIVLIITLLAITALCFFKKIALPKWYYLGILGFICGWILLYVSPGSTKRMLLWIEMGQALSISDIANLGIVNFVKRMLKIYSANSGFGTITICAVWLICVFQANISQKSKIILSLVATLISVLFYVFKLGFIFLHLGILSLFFFAFYYKKYNIRFYKLIIISTFLLILLCLYLDSIIQLGSIFPRAKLHLAFINMALMLSLMLYLHDFKFIITLRKIFVVLCILQILHVGVACVDARLRWNKMLDSIALQKSQGKRDIVIDSKYYKTPLYKRYGDWVDPASNPNDEFNQDYAKYFGVDTFVAKNLSEDSK